ncbi:MAG: hypothetical protein WKG00_24150 [Polyangiaceae bacterium]
MCSCDDDPANPGVAAATSGAGAGGAGTPGPGGSAGEGGAGDGAGGNGAGSGGMGAATVGGGGAGGSGGAPKDIGASLDADFALRAAVFIGSCIPDDGINRNLRNMYNDAAAGSFYHYYRNEVDCFANKANGCAAVEECLGIAVDKVSAGCPSSCNGDVYTGCDKTLQFTADCSVLGLSCDEGLSCTETVPGPACDPGSFASACDQGALLYCAGGKERHGMLCAEYGLSCQTVSTSATCVGPGPACVGGSTSGTGASLDSGLACAGGDLVACVNGGELQVACESVTKGSTCQSASGESFCALATECVPPGGDATCQGDSVVVCNAGRLDVVDCTALGFTGCLSGVCIPTGYYP